MVFPVKDGFGVGGARVGGEGGVARAVKRLFCTVRATEMKYHEGTHEGCPYGGVESEKMRVYGGGMMIRGYGTGCRAGFVWEGHT